MSSPPPSPWVGALGCTGLIALAALGAALTWWLGGPWWAVGAGTAQKTRRPLNHNDYASWRSIQGPQLSADGAFLAYSLAPQEGDGEFIVRNLRTGKEWRQPRGQRGAVAAGARGAVIGRLSTS